MSVKRVFLLFAVITYVYILHILFYNYTVARGHSLKVLH